MHTWRMMTGHAKALGYNAASALARDRGALRSFGMLPDRRGRRRADFASAILRSVLPSAVFPCVSLSFSILQPIHSFSGRL